MRLQVEIATASAMLGWPVSSRISVSAPPSSSASFSRSASGAVLCEVPRASSSLIAAPPRAPASRCSSRRAASSASSAISREIRESLAAMIAT